MSDVLSLDTLAAKGGFTGGDPTKRAIQWTDPEGNQLEATVYVRPLSYHTAVSDMMAAREDGGDAVAARIANTICDAEGKPIFSVADITGDAHEDRGPLSDELTFALLSAIGEANRPKAQKSSTEKPSSSAS